MPADDKLDILKQMLAIIGDALLEGERRSIFLELSARYDEIAAQPKKRTTPAPKAAQAEAPLPDVHEAFRANTREGFISWALTFDLSTLKRLVKSEQLDPAGRSKAWRKSERVAELIHDQLKSRYEHGAAFGRIGAA